MRHFCRISFRPLNHFVIVFIHIFAYPPSYYVERNYITSGVIVPLIQRC